MHFRSSKKRKILQNIVAQKISFNNKTLLYKFQKGTFAVQTDHAVDAELNRRVSGYMSWWKFGINLAWLGFVDAHSDIVHYFINIGSTFMGADLNAVKQIVANFKQTGKYSHVIKKI